ncbi:MAG: ECF transporter S component [Clostridia bacterium]|nr:ECF transporter S component [Clostridia bacterium]
MKRNRQTRFLQQIVLASLFAAMTTVLTFYIKIPAHNGYIHLGDSIIYLAASFLPTPLAMICAGLGGMLADALGGYTLYMLPTFAIKSLLVLPFGRKSNKILTKRSLVALPAASLITVAGYYIAEVVIISVSSTNGFGQFCEYFFSSVAWASAIYSIPGNIIQAVGSAIIFIMLGAALDKIKIKDKI